MYGRCIIHKNDFARGAKFFAVRICDVVHSRETVYGQSFCCTAS